MCRFGNTALQLLPFTIKHNISKFANLIVVGHHQEKKLIEMGLDRSKIHRIPCGAPIPAEAATPSKSNFYNFLVVGRLVPKKALLNTLEAEIKIVGR